MNCKEKLRQDTNIPDPAKSDKMNASLGPGGNKPPEINDLLAFTDLISEDIINLEIRISFHIQKFQ